MAEPKFAAQQSGGQNGFKEAVCINAGRIYDSCSDKDCLEDLQVYFTPLNQSIIDNSTAVKCKNVQGMRYEFLAHFFILTLFRKI